MLISAPTGSGKTLAAFLICLDDLVRSGLDAGRLPEATQVLYVSPLKALSNDIHKNLEVPLSGIAALAAERGLLLPAIRTAVRTGDTPTSERQRMVKHPPHILVTTPESLFILLTSERSRQALRGVRTVIVDEIHAMADDKRGAHLALTLARLDHLVEESGNERGRSASACRRPSGQSRRSRDFLHPTRRRTSPSSTMVIGAPWTSPSKCRTTSSGPSHPTRCGRKSTTA